MKKIFAISVLKFTDNNILLKEKLKDGNFTDSKVIMKYLLNLCPLRIAMCIQYTTEL